MSQTTVSLPPTKSLKMCTLLKQALPFEREMPPEAHVFGDLAPSQWSIWGECGTPSEADLEGYRLSLQSLFPDSHSCEQAATISSCRCQATTLHCVL